MATAKDILRNTGCCSFFHDASATVPSLKHQRRFKCDNTIPGSMSNSSTRFQCSTNCCNHGISNVHDFFVHVAAKVEIIHQYIQSMKTTYLADHRGRGDVNDPFLEADRRETAKQEAAGITSGTGVMPGETESLAYCVVATESVGRLVPMAFLERIKENFTKRYGGGKATAAPANSLSKEFGPKLKEHMQYCIEHPEEISKIAKVKAQISEVKGVMMENIEKVLDRGEKIELLVD
ncbi:VAMP721 protein [Hibiscus syriacus]|uniref:VAMP721 protein n=1 Tax=Hibiscus syriacus TaxID=106335 RepID=A0A6A2ZGQ5_HIBSY|nr:VAMP721 protein [Hibiscus syriacus]